MKLLYKIVLRVSLALTMVLALWAVLFYVAMTDEINDEQDDALEDYAAFIIQKALLGDSLPSKDSGSNNQYFLTKVSETYVQTHPRISYADSMIYVGAKQETEPARIYTTLFKDAAGDYYKLQVALPSFEKEDLKESVLLWVVLLYFILLVSIIIITAFVCYQSVKPLNKLLKWLNSRQLGGVHEPLVNPTSITEFRALNDAAIRYSQRSEAIYEQQKQFISNASHEMQTPLAICRNRLEILLEEGNLTDSQQEDIVKTHQTLERLSRMNQSLLLLSKIENGQFGDKKSVVLNELVKSHLEDYAEVFSYKNIELTLHESGVFSCLMNETLADMLLTNLLKNAYVHSPESGYISIQITANEVRFSNGPANEPLDSANIFDRFFKSDKSKQESSGLGLSIAMSICQTSHRTLDYSFNNNTHSFTIS